MMAAKGRWRRLALAGGACLLALALPVMAQPSDDDDRPDWHEDPAPPPPAYSLSHLIEIDMPRDSSVKLGIDPKTITINQKTGIVRYVVVAQGLTAVNASYEGMRCATGEYKVYARQTKGNPWSVSSAAVWKPMFGQSGIVVAYPARLARGGMCVGVATPQTVENIVRDLRSGNQSLYN